MAFAGRIVAVSLAELPTVRETVVWSRVTPVTEMVSGFTVNTQVAFLPPSAVVTVMVAVPAFFAVTMPFETVATVVLEDDQVTFWFVALDGLTVAVKVSVLPTIRVAVDLLSVTLVTEMVSGFTVNTQVAFLPPSAVVTVMVAVPAFFAVTMPFETVATVVLEDDQVTFWFVALDGLTVAVKVSVLPTMRVAVDLLSVTPVTEMVSGFTVNTQVAFLPPSAVVTVMVAVPTFFATTRPVEETVATVVSEEDQVTF